MWFTWRTAVAAKRQADAASAHADKAIQAAADNTAVAIRDANSRAERDLYRDTLIKIAECFATASALSHDPIASEALQRCRALVTVLPPSLFPLPVIRTRLNVDGKPPDPPRELAEQANGSEFMTHMSREIAAAVAGLVGRPYEVFDRDTIQVAEAATASSTGAE